MIASLLRHTKFKGGNISIIYCVVDGEPIQTIEKVSFFLILENLSYFLQLTPVGRNMTFLAPFFIAYSFKYFEPAKTVFDLEKMNLNFFLKEI